MIASRWVTCRLVHQEAMHRLDVVANGGAREPGAVVGLGRVAGRGRMTVAEELGRDEEVPRGVQRQAGPDEPVVVVMVRHVARRQEDDVVFPGVEPAVRAVAHDGAGQRGAVLEGEAGEDEPVVRGMVGRGGLHGRDSGRGQGEEQAEAQPSGAAGIGHHLEDCRPTGLSASAGAWLRYPGIEQQMRNLGTAALQARRTRWHR